MFCDAAWGNGGVGGMMFRTDGREMEMESIDAGADGGVKCGAQICADPLGGVL